MITNILATIVVSLYTNVHEHHWSPVLKTQVREVSQRSTWTFPNGIPDYVAEETPVSQTTVLFTLQNGLWVETTNGRTSGIFVVGGQYSNGTGWIYVPHPQAPCPLLPQPSPHTSATFPR